MTNISDKIIKIGYQGSVGSNSEEAAKEFAKRNEIKYAEFVPLVESLSVITELKKGRIDFGVVATKNSIAGIVKETFDAIKNEYLEFVETCIIPIHHCLYMRSDADESELKYVSSHIQALQQTRKTRAECYPHLEELAASDTAMAAKELADNSAQRNRAVVCRANAGEMYGLRLIKANIEDNADNKTEFRVFKLPSMDYSNKNKPTVAERLNYAFTSEKGVSLLLKIIIALLALVSLFIILNKVIFKNDGISKIFNSELFAALNISGYLLSFVLLLLFDKRRKQRKYKSIVGYWKYYSLSAKNIDNVEQQFSTPRIVEIYIEDGKLKFRGSICDESNVPFFVAEEGILSELDASDNKLIYFYRSAENGFNQRAKIGGTAVLEWSSKHPAARVNKMEGRYYGSVSGDEGTLCYLRITEEERDRHKNSVFLK